MQQILETVADHLMSRDEDQIRVPEIAADAGVNYGSVYHHFGSREGVINAAYNMIFSRFVQEDIDMMRSQLEATKTMDDYLNVFGPKLVSMSLGPDRVKRRALRVRVVAAAMTRPSLRALIGESQARVTKEFRDILQASQDRGFLRAEMSADAVAVMLQVVTFGRTLDDISTTPISDLEWSTLISQILVAFVKLD